jgi:sulfite reductase (NADPH) flavoprotein alpha-component
LTGFYTAFSRDQRDKVYVQHRILEHATELYDAIITRSATIVIAGSAKQMPTQVVEAIQLVLVQMGVYPMTRAV